MSGRLTLPRIYPITDRDLSERSHQDQVALLIEGGAEIIQIRDKYASGHDFFFAAGECVEIAHKTGVRLIVNDRVDIAAAVKADGVHIGQDDLPPAEARRILGDDAIIGLSTHTVEQAIAAADLPIDYIAAGPVFDTGTKSDRESSIGIHGLSAIRRATGAFPLVAIGGISLSDLDQLFSAGVGSAAMISSLVEHPNSIVERMRTALESSTKYNTVRH